MLISQSPLFMQNKASVSSCPKVTFGGSYSHNLAEATKVLAKIKDRGIESYNTIHTEGKGLTSAQKELASLKVVYLKRKLDALRKYIFNCPFVSAEERRNKTAQKVMQYGVGNCGEKSELVTELLARAGVNALHVKLCKFAEDVDAFGQRGLINRIDHGMVLVTDEKIPTVLTPIRMLMKMKDVIVVDAWLGKIFKSVPQAVKEYGKLFGLEMQDHISKINTSFKDVNAHLNPAQREAKRKQCERTLRREIKDIEDWYAETKSWLIR